MLLSIVILTTLASGDVKLPPPRPWQPPAVKLLEPGAEPRAPLRYQLKKGTAGHADLTGEGTWRITQSSVPHEGPLPYFSTPLDVAVQSPTAWTFKFAKATVRADEDDLLTASIFARLEGISGTVTVDDRGLASVLGVQPSPLDTQHKQDASKIEVASYYALEVARTTFMHLLVPFPSEPIGIGGTWQVERPTTRGSLTYLEVVTFKLVSRDAKGARLEVRLSGKPDPHGPVRPDQLDLQVHGEAQADVVFAAVLPTRYAETLELHALMGPKTEQRAEHEGKVVSQLRFEGKSPP